MASIKGYFELLSKDIGDPLNEQQQHYVTVIQNSVIQMDWLVQDLLDISRIETGQMRLKMEPVIPSDIVSEAVQGHEQRGESPGVAAGPAAPRRSEVAPPPSRAQSNHAPTLIS